MADAPVVHIGENSPEKIAFKLLEAVAAAEKKTAHGINHDRGEPADRKWILDTYAECLDAVKWPESRLNPDVSKPEPE